MKLNNVKALTVGLIAIFSVCCVTTSVWAGSAHDYRMEGLAWGIGAAILGKVILDHHRNAAPAPRSAMVRHHHQRPPGKTAGRWEIRREWVPAEVKRVWNPGHYNRRGKWVRGHWIRVQIEPGYWREKQVWVPYY